MAGRGRMPKPVDQRASKAALGTPLKMVTFNGSDFPDLPGGIDWHPRTRAWWATWQECEQAAHFTNLDWQFLLDTAWLHHDMWANSKTVHASEIRLRMAKLGATMEDRARLRITFTEANVKDPAGTASPTPPTSDARDRLKGLLKPAAGSDG